MAYGFGIIGCGMISRFHAKAIADVKGAKLVACFDTYAESAQKLADETGCRPYSDFKAFLADKDLDIVTIGTPSGAHMEPAVAAAKAGKHVIVEKPLEITLKKCDAIIKACADNNVKLSTIFPSRFHEPAVEIKKAIEGKRFGKITMGDAYVKWFRTQQYYDSGKWRGTWELDGGGALMNQAVHSVDLLTYFMGPVVEVTAQWGTLAHERIAVEDTVVATLKFANGALGVIEASTAAYPGYLKRIEISGSEGTAVMEEEDIKVWDFAKKDSRRIGTCTIGAEHPIAVQSMTATHTQDIDATVAQVNACWRAGADVVRIAVDSARTPRRWPKSAADAANLAVDLQENYRLAEVVAPHVDKIRYNPGHLYHHEREKPWQEKVRTSPTVAATRLRDSRRRELRQRRSGEEGSTTDDSITPMLESALEHCELLDELGFTRYCVSLKDSDPAKVIEVNRRFAEQRPDVPLHLGVTEAGMPPDGIIKTRIAFEQLISRGIGDTIRVSLTVPNDRKPRRSPPGGRSWPTSPPAASAASSTTASRRSTSSAAQAARASRTRRSSNWPKRSRNDALRQGARITIAVMGCRVNGPGETDDADLGLWCGPNFVNLKDQEIAVVAYFLVILN
jgi:UDP-N-acetyl-2-amino-2-deoxyglucuronate dehydrogenase